MFLQFPRNICLGCYKPPLGCYSPEMNAISHFWKYKPPGGLYERVVITRRKDKKRGKHKLVITTA